MFYFRGTGFLMIFVVVEGHQTGFHSGVDQEDLDQCTKMLSTWLCPHVKVVHSGVKPCLMALYNNEDHEKACPTKVEHGTFNLKSLTPGLYLLTTLEPILLT